MNCATLMAETREFHMQSETSIQNAVIKRAELISSDHDCLTTWLTLDYGSTGQKFGGYTLYLSKGFTHHSLKSTAGHFIWRVMEIAGGGRVGSPC